MTSLTLLTAQDFDDLTASNIYVDNIYSNEATNISIQSASNFLVEPSINGTGLSQYTREQLTVSGALDYSATTGLLTGISVDNYNRDVILSLSGTTILSADLTSGTGQSLVLYMNYSQTVGSNKALGITPTNTSQTILSTSIPGNTTSLIATFEILQATLNQTFIPSGIFDITLFTAEDNPNDGLEVYAELYTVSSLGVETLFATTDQIEVVEEYPNYGETTLSAVNVEQEALEIGGAFRMKIYGVNSRGSAHTLYTYYEGSGAGYSHMHTPFNVALAGGYWSENGTTVYLTNTGNNVAIGKTSATERLEVSGNILANTIIGLNVSAGTGVYNYLSGLSISGTGIKCDTATFNAANILGLATNNLNANNLTVVSSSTFNGAFTVATSASFNVGISVGQSSTFMGEVLVGSGNSTSLFVGGRTTIGDNGLRLHTPLSGNISTFIDTKQPAGGSLVFRLDDTLGATERMRLSQTGLSVRSTTMSNALVVGGSILSNNNETIGSQGVYMSWNRQSQINPIQAIGSVASRGIGSIINQRGSGSGGIVFGEANSTNNFTANAFLDYDGNLFLRGTLVASGGRSQVFDLNVSGNATFNTISATFIQSYTFNGFNLTITGRDFNNTSGVVQGRFDAGYMPDGNYVQLAGTRASAFPGVDGDSVISFYSKNAVPAGDAFFSTRLTSQGGDPNSVGDGRFTIRSGSLQFQQGGVRMLTMTGGFSTSFNTNLNISGALSLSGPMTVSSNASFLSNITANNYRAKHWTGSTSTAGTPLFYRLATFGTTTDNNNAGGVRIHGEIGGWLSGAVGVVDFEVSTRNQVMIGGTFYSINATALSSVTSFIEFVLYIETNNTYTLYMVVNSQFSTYDFMVSCNTSGVATSPVIFDPTTTAVVPTGSVSVSNILTNRIKQYNLDGALSISGNMSIGGQYSRLGVTLNASAPMVYSITFNRFSMPQVDDVGTDGYLSSAQYSAIISSSTVWTADTTNRILAPASNNYNVMSYNTDVSGSPAVRDTGMIWRRTLLSGTLDHSLRIRTGGTKDGYLIHQTQSNAPMQLCSGSTQPALLLGGTFNDLIDAGTAFQIRTFQNNTPTLMKLQMSGVSSAFNYSEIQLQDPTNNMSFRTAGNSENLLIRDNTRGINRIQITPTTLSHAGTQVTLASSGNNRLDIGNAGNSGQFIDFNVGVSPPNDFDARIICNLGTTGTNGAGNVDWWSGSILFVQPSVDGASRTRITNTGAIGVQCSPSTALTVSGNIRLNNTAGALQFSDANVEIVRRNNGMELETNGTTRLNISQNGVVAIGLTFNAPPLGETQNSILKVGGFETNTFGGQVLEPLALINTNRNFSSGKETRISFYQYVGSLEGDVGRAMSIGCVMESGDGRNSGLLIQNVNNGNLQVALGISANGDTTLIRVRDSMNVINRTVAGANTVNGRVSFQGTLTGGTLNETGLIQSVAFAGNASNINSLMIFYTNNGSGVVETMRMRGDTREVVVGQDSGNTSIFLNDRTQAGGNGGRWHWNGSHIYFDAKAGTSPDFFFRSDTSSGATNRFQILGAGGTTCFGAMGQTVRSAIGSTITYWSSGGVLGVFSSDKRSKNSIEPIDDTELGELWETMRPVKYFFNIDANNPINPDTGVKRKYYGFIANDLDSRIQMENKGVKIQMCRKCQMRCFHDAECECQEYNDLECECLPEWTINIRNYNERDMIAILTAKLKQQERTIVNMQEQLVKERVQYRTMEDKQNKKVINLEKQVGTLNYQMEKLIGALAFKGISVKF